MKISITHGFHPEEYTKPYAEETGRLLSERGYDVTVDKVPFEKTGWGVAFRGGSEDEIYIATNGWVYVPHKEADYIFDFHTSPRYEFVEFAEIRFGPDDYENIEKCGRGILYTSWRKSPSAYFKKYCNGVIPNGYIIEMPQIYRDISEKFIETLKKKTNRPFPIEDVHAMLHFELIADKAATLKKYPLKAMSRIISDGIEEQIITQQLLVTDQLDSDLNSSI